MRPKFDIFVRHSVIFLTFAVLTVHADIVSVSGPKSNGAVTTRQPPMIIPNPVDLLEDCILSGAPGFEAMIGFNEAQGVTTSADHDHNGGTIPAGSVVSSHMIFLNAATTNTVWHQSVVWTFSEPILGVMSDTDGNMEASSTSDLGHPSVNYTSVPSSPSMTSCGTNAESGEQAAPFVRRGMEANNGCDASHLNSDGYTISGNQLTICMFVNQPGDWARVITQAPAEPTGSCDDGKPKKLVFRYTGEDCFTGTNDQTLDTCNGDPLDAEPVKVVFTGKPKKFGGAVSPSTETVNVGDLVTLQATTKATLPTTTKLEIKQGSTVLQTLLIHTSCSQPLNAGDQFGSMVLVDYVPVIKGKPSK